MSMQDPAGVHRLFIEYFTAGNIDALVALYEPDAVLLPQPGSAARGVTAIREALAGFMAMKGEFRMAPARVIQADGIAVLFADWTLSATGPDGSPVHLSGQTTDVVRRQADGQWRFVIDSPFGAAGVSA